MTKLYCRAQVERDEKRILAIATDETIDRHGEVLPIDSWDFKNFKKNPVLMFNHDYWLPPVGVVKNIKLDGKRVTFEPQFHEITQLAREVKQMYDEGIMNSFSVGFIPNQPKKEGQKVMLELLEISAVSIPANPNARVSEKSLLASDDEKAQLKNWLKTFEETTVCDSSKATPMEVQSIICSKEQFKTEQDAKQWVTSHDFLADKIDETKDNFRFKQFEHELCQEESIRTIEIDEGIKAAICRKEKSADGLIVPFGFIAGQKKLADEIRSLTEKLENSYAAASSLKNSGDDKGRKYAEAQRRKTRILRGALRRLDKEIGLTLREVNKQ